MPNTLASDYLLESLESAVVVIDHEGILQRVNLAAETLFEQSRRKLLGRPLAQLVASTKLEDCLTECLLNRARFTLREIALTSRDVLVDMSLAPITLNGEARELKSSPAVLIEINSINRITQFIKEKNQLERQSAFRLMMRGLAHEIKNPLGGIRGAAQLLERELKDEGQRELTNILTREADRLTRLVDRVMGSREQLKLLQLNIHEVLEHVAHLVTVNSGGSLEIRRFYDPTLPEIMADKEQLIQAVLNIVGNGIEAQGGQAKPVIGLETKFERAVTINQQKYRHTIKVKIWDNGPGVPDEIRDTLFDPLITGRAEGSGLGLSITQEIIQRHKGAVSLERHNDKTCFTLILPFNQTGEMND